MALRKRLVAAGLATFAAGIVITFPANVAYDWFAPPDVRLSGISGTVWRGQAAEGAVAGIGLNDLRWRFKPLSILKGRLLYAIESNSTFGAVRSAVGVGIDGSLVVQDFAGTISLQELRDVFQVQEFEGTLQVLLETLVLKDGFPIKAAGTVRLSNLLAPQLSPLAIGDYRADFTSNADGIVGSVEDTSGVLDVSGTILLSADRSYSFVGTVAARPAAPHGLTSQLQFLGSPDERGLREFRIEGRL